MVDVLEDISLRRTVDFEGETYAVTVSNESIFIEDLNGNICFSAVYRKQRGPEGGEVELFVNPPISGEDSYFKDVDWLVKLAKAFLERSLITGGETLNAGDAECTNVSVVGVLDGAEIEFRK